MKREAGGEEEQEEGRRREREREGEDTGQQPPPAPSQLTAGERAFVGLWSQARLVWPSPAKTYTGRILHVLNACFTNPTTCSCW